MNITYDINKNETNIQERGISFESVKDFDFDTAIVKQDTRFNYGEVRFVAIGNIGNRLHVLVFTIRSESIRVISLRKANSREINRYEA